VLFDCPPSLGKLLFAVLLTVDDVYAITEPTKDSVKGVTRLETTVQKVKLRPNPRLEARQNHRFPPPSACKSHVACGYWPLQGDGPVRGAGDRSGGLGAAAAGVDP
jgi:hypothetical protein